MAAAKKEPARIPATVDAAKAKGPDALAHEVLSPLEHDGVRYAIGDVLALTEAQARPLLGHTVRAVAAVDAAVEGEAPVLGGNA